MHSLSEAPLEVHTSAFDFDDAFSDGESNDLPYRFSPEVIRKEFARSIPPTESSWSETDTDVPFAAENSSVSTLDINGDGQQRHHSHSSTESGSQEQELHDHFFNISLSGDQDEPCRGPADALAMGDGWNSAYTNVTLDTFPQNTPLSGDSPAGYPANHDEGAGRVNSSPQPSLEHPPDSGKSTQSLPIPMQTSYPVRPQPLSTAVAPDQILSPSRSSTSAAKHPSSVPSKAGTMQKPFGHRSNRSSGPSTFEKVRSKTRPTFLPPKPRQEDEKHMADWQTMMKLSRNAAEKKRKALRERRFEREKRIEESILIWEKEIVPDWRAVHKKPALRKLWWRGIPTRLRASMWERAVGNSLALSKDHYRTCLSRAKRALHSGAFPQASLSLIEEDISTTLPSLHIFHRENGPLHEELRDMLCAWVVARSDEGLGYTLGAAKIAAMLLINMPVQQGFVVMRNLLERHCMRSFFGGEGSHEDVEAYYRIFDTLLADGMPKIYFNFKQHQISPSAYLIDWIVPLFLDHLPFEACARIWDVLLLEGDSFLYRTALAILAVLEPRLFFPDRRELLELLKGENKAALDVARREGRALDGGKYEVYGVDEETLWERIDDMEDWWKESMWERLLRRELPDL